MQLDASFAPIYEKARTKARDASQTWEERDAKLVEWETARTALMASGLALKSAALTLQIADNGQSMNWKTQVAGALDALEATFDTLDTVGIRIPAGARKAILVGRQALNL
jgi:hypothetical protein